MLIQLSVENIAIIERLAVDLEEGLNVLTGETGAGKSILIDAINALLGGRVSRDLIRTGEDRAKVEAVFSMPSKLSFALDNMGIETGEDGELVLSRRFSLSGKNVCRVNGNLVTVSQLKEIGEYLIDIHGQHDNQSLLRKHAQEAYLDLFSGSRLLKEKEAYRERLKEFHTLNRKITELKSMEKERARLEDLYRYQSGEILAAGLKNGEDEELLRQSKLLSNAEGIMEALQTAYISLAGEENDIPGAMDMVQRAQTATESIAEMDPEFRSFSDKLMEVADRLMDVTREVRLRKENVNFDPQRQQEVEERLAFIDTLKRKYGNTVGEIIEYGEYAQKKLDEVTGTENLLGKLTDEKNRLNETLYKKAYEMHELRLAAALELKEKVTKELRDLEIPKAEFQVDIRFDEHRQYTENGLDSIEFLISPNPGEGLKPLSRIASGGELSRIMLAIKTILADIDETGVLIFDEIDTGVSGKAALKVGEKLLDVSQKHQVLCITHHAQIASLASVHYHIQKSTEHKRTVASLKRLEKKEREIEIARLLSGEDSDSTTKLAKEMIRKGERLRAACRGNQNGNQAHPDR